MELSKIERLKELIQRRDALLDDIKKIKTTASVVPKFLTFEWESGYCRRINIHHATYDKINGFLLNLLNEELEKINKYILDL